MSFAYGQQAAIMKLLRETTGNANLGLHTEELAKAAAAYDEARIAANTAVRIAAEEQIAENEEDIVSNAVDIATNATNIATNFSEIATIGTDISMLEGANVTLAAANTTNSTNAATNAANIATNAGGIASNAATLQTIGNNLDFDGTNIDCNSKNLTGVGNVQCGAISSTGDIGVAGAVSAVNTVLTGAMKCNVIQSATEENHLVFDGTSTNMCNMVVNGITSLQANGLSTDIEDNVYLGTPQLSTNSTAGFAFIPTIAGTPIGIPSASGQGSRVAMCFCNAQNRMYVYNNSVTGTPGWYYYTFS